MFIETSKYYEGGNVMSKRKENLIIQDVRFIGLLVRCDTKKQMMKVSNNIHNQLKGNKDYVENRIILSTSHDIKEFNDVGTVFEEGHRVYIWLFDGVKLPPLKVKIPKSKKKKAKKVKKGDKKKK